MKQDPMVKKIGGYASQLLMEAARFQFEQLPLKPKKITKKIEYDGIDDELEKEFYVFKFKWNHPVIDYSVEIIKEIPVEEFEVLV
jgi:hypothetical protein